MRLTRTVAASVVAIVSIGSFVVGLLLASSDDGSGFLYGAATASTVLVGVLLIARAPENRIGPLLLLSGALLPISAALSQYGRVGATQVPPWPAIGIVAIHGSQLLGIPILIVLVGIPLIFPNGHLLSPRWRWLVALVIAALVAGEIQNLIAPDQSGPAGVDGFVGIPALAPLAQVLGAFSTVSLVLGFGAGALAVAIRFRNGGPVERQQLKWLLAVAALAAIFFPMSAIVPEGWIEVFFGLGVLTLIALPVAIAIAILRYHLFEIDRIVSRTIGYAVITGVLVTAYAGLVIVIGEPLSNAAGGQTISVALSTLAVAALFQPVRRRVQRVVDRRFYRAHYNAEQTGAEFSERLRDEVDIAAVTADLRATVLAALRPEHVGFWIRQPRR